MPHVSQHSTGCCPAAIGAGAPGEAEGEDAGEAEAEAEGEAEAEAEWVRARARMAGAPWAGALARRRHTVRSSAVSPQHGSGTRSSRCQSRARACSEGAVGRKEAVRGSEQEVVSSGW